MADRVVEKTETVEKEAPRDTVVVHDREPQGRGSNAGIIIGVIIVLIILLFLLFGRGLFNGGGGGSGGTSGTSSTGTSGQ